MTTFEKCQVVRRIIMNRAAEVISYTNWDDDFAVRQIRDAPADLLAQSPELGGIQPSELTDAECDNLGFSRWSEENPIRLIPLWLLPFLADEIKASSVSGREVFRKADMDNDNRFGCLAYGVLPCDVTRRHEVGSIYTKEDDAMADCEVRTFEPHQQRVVDERRELDEKRQRLSNFFGTATFEGLGDDEKLRLRMQYDAMSVYSGILTQRIRAF